MTRLAAEEGFTLVEMLVSLALLALAATLVTQTFAVGRRTAAHVEASASRVDEVAAAQDLLRDRIEHLFADAKFSSTSVSVDLAGHAHDLEFVTGEPDPVRASALQRQRVTLAPDGDLTLASRPDAPSAAFSAPFAILHGVRALTIDYLPPSSAGPWRSSWIDQPTPPALVRMRVRFAEADPRTWPELIVRPAVTIDDACVLDRETGRCRGRT